MSVSQPVVRTLLSSALALMMALPAAADQPPVPDAARVQAVRDKVRVDRKAVVLSNMKLDAAQAAKFSPVYDAYAAELFELARQRTRMAVEAVNQGDPTGAQAKQSTKDTLTLAESEQKLLRKYTPKMVKAVGQTGAARFLDIETKLQALSHFDELWVTPLSE